MEFWRSSPLFTILPALLLQTMTAETLLKKSTHKVVPACAKKAIHGIKRIIPLIPKLSPRGKYSTSHLRSHSTSHLTTLRTIEQEADWAPQPVWKFQTEKYLFAARNWSGSSPSQPSHYTDWANHDLKSHYQMVTDTKSYFLAFWGAILIAIREINYIKRCTDRNYVHKRAYLDSDWSLRTPFV
jgi:hypothetical protein